MPTRGRSRSGAYRRSSPPVTAEMAAQIRGMLIHLDMNQHDIAAFFKVNQGRVSEVWNGKRHPEVPTAPLTALKYKPQN